MQLQGALRLATDARPFAGAGQWRLCLEGKPSGWPKLIGDKDYQQRALWALWVDRTNNGESREALVIAERICRPCRLHGRTG